MSGQGFPQYGLVAVALGLFAITACEAYEPEPRVQSFILPGPHATVECTSCHFDEPPFDPIVWDINCVACHDAASEKQQLGDPDYAAWGAAHYPQQSATTCSNNGACHTDAHLTWGEALGGCPDVDHSFLPLEGEHELGCGECHSSGNCETFGATDVVYNGVPIIDPPDTCMSCHENLRSDNHYEREIAQRPAGSELRGDCKACHDRVSREATPIVNDDFRLFTSFHGIPSVLVPHGTFGGVGYGSEDVALPPDQWVTECVDCHPADVPVVGNDAFQCTVACHLELFPVEGALHQGSSKAVGVGQDDECMVCHEAAEFMP